jgi:hypothetical protein
MERGADGSVVERLVVCPELATREVCRQAILERAGLLAARPSDVTARVRQADAEGVALVVRSDWVPGERLSDLVARRTDELSPLSVGQVLHVWRGAVRAARALQGSGPGVCHGALGASRFVVTEDGRLVLLDCAFGSALAALSWSPARLLEVFALRVPDLPGIPAVTPLTDQLQLGLLAADLICGFSSAFSDPAALAAACADATLTGRDGNNARAPEDLLAVVARALLLSEDGPFRSLLAMERAVDAVIARWPEHQPEPPPIDLAAAAPSLAAIGEGPGASPPLEEDRHVGGVCVTVLEVAPDGAGAGLASNDDPGQPSPFHASWPLPAPAPPPGPPLPPRDTVAADAGLSIVAATLVGTGPGSLGVAPTEEGGPPGFSPGSGPTPAPRRPPSSPAGPPIAAEATPHDGDLPADVSRPRPRAVPVPTATVPRSRRRWAVFGALVLVAAVSGGVWSHVAGTSPVSGWWRSTAGSLRIESVPPDATVTIDGTPRGQTPLTLSLPPGYYKLDVSLRERRESSTVKVEDGVEFVHRMTLTPIGPLGTLQITSTPAGATVKVDGEPKGSTPVTVADVPPGDHRVVAESGDARLERSVRVGAGTVVAVDLSLVGTIELAAPFEVAVYDRATHLGAMRSGRVSVPAGPRQLRFVNRDLHYEEDQRVDVPGGGLVRVELTPPNGAISFTADAEAEVWLDRRRLGSTPLPNVPVPLGSHEVVFRHPTWGEQRYTILVTLASPARLHAAMAGPSTAARATSQASPTVQRPAPRPPARPRSPR